MLSNRITAKRRLAKPTNHARERMVKVKRDCQPMVCVFPSLESIFLSLAADASLSSTSILESRPRFCGLTNQRLPAVTLGSSSLPIVFTVSKHIFNWAASVSSRRTVMKEGLRTLRQFLRGDGREASPNSWKNFFQWQALLLIMNLL